MAGPISEKISTAGMLWFSAIFSFIGLLSVSFVLPIMGRILDNAVGTEALSTMSTLPAILIVLYGGLFFVRRKHAAAKSAAG